MDAVYFVGLLGAWACVLVGVVAENRVIGAIKAAATFFGGMMVIKVVDTLVIHHPIVTSLGSFAKEHPWTTILGFALAQAALLLGVQGLNMLRQGRVRNRRKAVVLALGLTFVGFIGCLILGPMALYSTR